jgi:hypothetical protein
MTGGAGSDTYVVNVLGDRVVETAGVGSDTVLSAVSYTLGANLERLTLTGAAANGAGNTLANVLTGNAGANRLSGSGGNDTLRGLAGSDTLLGGAGADVLEGGVGRDQLTGGTGGDHFRFASAPSGADADRITDFRPIDDRIDLDNGGFTRLGAPGHLAAAAFRAGTVARDTSDRVIFKREQRPAALRPGRHGKRPRRAVRHRDARRPCHGERPVRRVSRPPAAPHRGRRVGRSVEAACAGAAPAASRCGEPCAGGVCETPPSSPSGGPAGGRAPPQWRTLLPALPPTRCHAEIPDPVPRPAAADPVAARPSFRARPEPERRRARLLHPPEHAGAVPATDRRAAGARRRGRGHRRARRRCCAGARATPGSARSATGCRTPSPRLRCRRGCASCTCRPRAGRRSPRRCRP